MKINTERAQARLLEICRDLFPKLDGSSVDQNTSPDIIRGMLAQIEELSELIAVKNTPIPGDVFEMLPEDGRAAAFVGLLHTLANLLKMRLAATQ